MLNTRVHALSVYTGYTHGTFYSPSAVDMGDQPEAQPAADKPAADEPSADEPSADEPAAEAEVPAATSAQDVCKHARLVCSRSTMCRLALPS
jgi:hypothetical protein